MNIKLLPTLGATSDPKLAPELKYCSIKINLRLSKKCDRHKYNNIIITLLDLTSACNITIIMY